MFPFRLDKFCIKGVKFKKDIFSINFKYVSYLRFFNYFKLPVKLLSNYKVNNFVYEYWKKNETIKLENIKNKLYFFKEKNCKP